jgi:hypothetical protein
MFNAKISLLYFLLVLLSVVSILMTVWSKQDAAVTQIRQSMESLPEVFRLHQELREERLRDYAIRVGNSEIKARLRVLHDVRADFLKVDRYILDAETGVPVSVPGAEEQRKKLAQEKFGETVFKQFASDLTREVKAYKTWSDKEEQAFQAGVTNRLSECFHWSKRCAWAFSYLPLVNDVLPMMKRTSNAFDAGPGTPDLLLVFDSDGTGLAKANDGGAWSNNDDFKGMVQALRGRVKNAGPAGLRQSTFDVVRMEETLYLVAVAPILGTNGQFLGAIMAGESVTGRMVGSEETLFAHEVTYLSGTRSEETVIATTLSPPSGAQFMLASAKGTHKMKSHPVSSENWVGISFPYYSFRAVPSGDSAYGVHYKKLRVVMAVDKRALLGPFQWLESLVLIFGAVIFFFGLILIWLLVRTHNKPFEQIDSGIHEVINGNHDYQFAFDYKDELPSSMAQSLNLMVAVLQGKNIDDDDGGEPGWDPEQFGVAATQNTSGVSAQKSIAIGRSGDVTDVNRDALFSQPAEQYYRDLYSQHREARSALGEDVSDVTYVRFVERLVRSERELKRESGASDVRFVVRTVDNQVDLAPIRKE